MFVATVVVVVMTIVVVVMIPLVVVVRGVHVRRVPLMGVLVREVVDRAGPVLIAPIGGRTRRGLGVVGRRAHRTGRFVRHRVLVLSCRAVGRL